MDNLLSNLPRDIQLRVINKFDIDTRIKTGLIFKLKVPMHILNKIMQVQLPEIEQLTSSVSSFVTSTIDVGPYYISYSCRYKHGVKTIQYWEVCDIHGDTCYTHAFA